MSTAPGCRALLLVGAVGVGKTTTADAIGDELEGRGVPGAVIDLDAIRRGWPAPPGDRFNSAIELANLRAVAQNFREAGAEVLVAAGVMEKRAARDRYEEAMGVPLTVVRLVAPRDLVRSRLHRRHELEPESLTWHLDRFDELTAILDVAAVEDVTVPVAEDPRATARALLDAVWRGELGRRIDDVVEDRVELGTFKTTGSEFERRHPSV
ncbi:AAA family ATPase [Brachybacterium paraconglomeratum]|uniref:AAA family ATPase n=1 Tax=Brachybacterium paraconglomeratum TaxID=173362 RepID=UPI003FD4A574